MSPGDGAELVELARSVYVTPRQRAALVRALEALGLGGARRGAPRAAFGGADGATFEEQRSQLLGPCGAE